MLGITPLNQEWNFRITDQRLILLRTKNEKVRKAAALDILTNLPFALNIPTNIDIKSLYCEKEYLATVNVYSSNNLEGVGKDFINFFEASDVNQSIEDFLKTYWIHPGKIRFELVKAEEP
jgi:hypothetical protein